MYTPFATGSALQAGKEDQQKIESHAWGELRTARRETFARHANIKCFVVGNLAAGTIHGPFALTRQFAWPTRKARGRCAARVNELTALWAD